MVKRPSSLAYISQMSMAVSVGRTIEAMLHSSDKYNGLVLYANKDKEV